MKKETSQTKQLNKSECGITLVALIITIIILIILAVVTINSLTHDGLADMAIKGAEDYDKAQQNEMNMLNEIDSMVRDTIKNIEDGITKPKPEEPTNPWNKDDLEEVKVKDENGNDISIPKLEDSEILNPDAKVDEGIVMKDSKDNEWVWVPVDEVTYNSMFVENSSGVEMAGATSVKATKYSKSATMIGQNVQSAPNSISDYREPGIVVGNGSQYDAVESDRNTASTEFTTLEKMAEILRDEYNKMADSIKKYGGFYIGRYELTSKGSKTGEPVTGINWYELYNKCKNLTIDDTKATVRMIWGCQWDATFLWLKNTGINIKDSGSYGNYSGSIKNTGVSDMYKTNNIYDLARKCMGVDTRSKWY